MKKFLLAGLILMGVGAVTASQIQNQPITLITSYEFENHRPVSPFELIDQDGKPFNNTALMGQWNLVYVGYTSCPDICPMATAKLTAATQKIREFTPLQTIFVSVDPQRDTPERLKDYMTFFNTGFTAATAEHKQLIPFTRELGFAYSMVGDGEEYQVDHSASLILISPQGTRVAVIKPQAEELGKIPQIRNNDLIADIKQIIDKHG